MIIPLFITGGMLLLMVLSYYLLWGHVKIHPIEGPGFIKITRYERALCRAHTKIIHPKTRKVMRRGMESIPNCTPVWAQVALD